MSTKFQFRENEYNEIYAKLDENKVIVIYGKAGTGKTRLTLEVARNYSKDNNYKLYCIKSNDMAIAEDFATYISTTEKYLIFIDDANELIQLKYILEYLNMDYMNYNIKLIMTVRDYAKQKVLQDIHDYTRPYLIKIDRFSDEEIKKFLNVNMDINNENYIDHIIRIAEGNPRIAYMAGKLAKEEQKLSAIKDATELYKNYYDKYLKQSLITTDKKMCLSAGIISLLHTINMENLNLLEDIFKLANITKDDFCNSINKLFTMEFLEIKYNKVARITDQCLSNYMLYYTFFLRRYVEFSFILDIGFKHFRNGVIKATGILWNIFSSRDVREYLKKQINEVWDKYSKEDEQLYADFIKQFHDFRPEEALLFIKDKIDDDYSKEVDINNIDFTKNIYGINNSVLLMMTGYRYSDLLPEAIDLVLNYTAKRQDIVLETFELFKTYYSVNKYSYQNDYYTEKIISTKLVQHINDSAIYKLFIHIGEHLLSLKFTPTELEYGNKMVMYRIPVRCTEGSKKYRKLLWSKLINLSNNTRYEKDILYILNKYSYGWLDEIDTDMLSYDLSFIYQILEKLKDKNHLIVAKIYDQLSEKCKKYNIVMTEDFEDILKTSEWKIYSLFSKKIFDKDLDYVENDRLNEEKIKQYSCSVCNSDIEKIISISNNIVTQLTDEEWNINHSLNIFAEGLFGDYNKLMYFLKGYFDYGNKLDIAPFNILKKLSEYIDYSDIYELICKENFKQKNYWQYAFFEILPESEINNEYLHKLLSFFKSKSDEYITKSTFRSLRILDKFISIDKNIYCTVSNIIYNKKNHNKFIVDIYFRLLFNKHTYCPDELIEFYNSHLELLKKIYFFMLNYNNNEDYSGEFIKNFIRADNTWLISYIEYMNNNLNNHDLDVHERINSCWECENYIEIFDYIFYSFVEKDEIFIWRLKEVFRNLLIHQANQCKKANRQQEWIFHIINENYSNKHNIIILFEILSELGEKIRKESIVLFVSLNKDFNVFKELSLEASHWGGCGSMIPYMQKRIEFYKSLLPYFTGLDYLKHKKLIKDKIKIWEERIEKEQVDEIFEELYR